MNKMHVVFGLFFSLTLVACNQSDQGKDILANNIDTSVSPADDFFQYASGTWIKNNPIPASESSWGVGPLVQEDIYLRLKTINEKAATQGAAQGSVDQKIGDFWLSGMDSAAAEKQGLSALAPLIKSIESVTNINGLVELGASLQTKGVRVFFSAGVGQDDMNSNKNAFQISQGGLGMPNRDYYFNTDEKSVAVRNAYQHYLLKSFQQLGADSLAALQSAKAVYQLETKLAAASRKLADLRDPYKNYHKMTFAALQASSPAFPWGVYLSKIGIAKLDSVIVGQPEFLTALGNNLKGLPLSDWKKYLQVHLLRSNASFLNLEAFQNSFVYSQALHGAKEPKPRWKRVLDTEESAMGELLGQLFVKEYFNEKAKARYVKMVEDIREAYHERIAKLTWMSDSTKQKAFSKLAKITKKVGYPDQWKDFSSLKIDRESYVLNVMRAKEWWFHENISKYGKPVDRNEWHMTPQTYNAYYNPSNNEIVLPAGIFAVPGMKDEELDDAFVYGYAGASTIGHELTHGFDDQGRQYDEAGNLQNWWKEADGVQFNERAKKIIQQFNEFVPVDTIHVNGEATQGENIADLGGMLLGLDAFKKTSSYQSGKKIGGLTQLQRYFLGYAYGWLYQTRKESLATQLATDVHAPAKERVNGPVVNIEEFYQAFGIKKGDKMYRPDSLRVQIW